MKPVLTKEWQTDIAKAQSAQRDKGIKTYHTMHVNKNLQITQSYSRQLNSNQTNIILLLLGSSSRLLDNLFSFFLEGIRKVYYTYVILPDSSLYYHVLAISALYYNFLAIPALFDHIFIGTTIFIVALYYNIRRIKTFLIEIDINRYYNKPRYRSSIQYREIYLAGPICLGSVYRLLNFILFKLSVTRYRIYRIYRFLQVINL